MNLEPTTGFHSSGQTGKGTLRANLAAVIMLAVFAFAVSGLTSCESRTSWDDPGPKAAFQQYLMHWFKGEREEAYAMIAPEDRKVLEAPLEELEGRLQGSKTPSAKEMLVAGRVDNPYDIKRIDAKPELESEPEPGTKVELTLSYQDGRSGSATMMWDGESWFVDLPLESSVDDGEESEQMPPDVDSSDAGPNADDDANANADGSADKGK